MSTAILTALAVIGALSLVVTVIVGVWIAGCYRVDVLAERRNPALSYADEGLTS